ncbi:hypothetical protein TrCOL_g6748 [Triparma columacea]|uniref:Uncharacterized protein n=1 Tax=Triparma columacea TaxID=722753 RepID=A0A9W7L310_9STRA|nr:hypothetical protein TrCOL_g6748 [Triparma columacea]
MGAAASMVPPDAELELFNKLKAEYEANKEKMSDADLFTKLAEMYNAEVGAVAPAAVAEENAAPKESTEAPSEDAPAETSPPEATPEAPAADAPAADAPAADAA